jgi:hypothetical protein
LAFVLFLFTRVFAGFAPIEISINGFHCPALRTALASGTGQNTFTFPSTIKYLLLCAFYMYCCVHEILLKFTHWIYKSYEHIYQCFERRNVAHQQSVSQQMKLILFSRFHKDLMCTKVRVLENNGNVLTVQSTAVTYHVYHLIVDLAHPKFPPRRLLWVENFLLSFLRRTILLWHLLGSTGEFRLVLGWHCWTHLQQYISTQNQVLQTWEFWDCHVLHKHFCIHLQIMWLHRSRGRLQFNFSSAISLIW